MAKKPFTRSSLQPVRLMALGRLRTNIEIRRAIGIHHRFVARPQREEAPFSGGEARSGCSIIQCQ